MTNRIMKLPVELQNRIIDFLVSLPNMHDSESQRSLIYRAGLDIQVQVHIPIGQAPFQFASSLVSILTNYGVMNDQQFRFCLSNSQ